LTASKLAQDLLLLNTYEYGMIELGDEVAQRMHPITGSSIMPQKKNPDVLELIRSTAPQIIGYENIVANLLSSLPSGYNRDSREVKEYIELGISKVDLMLSSLEKVLSTLVVNTEKMKRWVNTDYSLTTDLADYISQKSGLGYRLVYKVVGKAVDELVSKGKPFTDMKASDIIRIGVELGVKLNLSEDELKMASDPIHCIEKRVHIGGTSRKIMGEMITKRGKSLEQRQGWIESQQKRIAESKQKTDSLVDRIIGAH
jgi:argininosuccinate lyase